MPTLAEDREAIRDLYARYCLYLDNGAAREWAALYADDGEFVGGGDRVVGRGDLEAYAARLQPGTVHRIVANHVIDVDADVAACQASVVLIAGGVVVSSGRTADELHRIAGSWRIFRRTYVSDSS